MEPREGHVTASPDARRVETIRSAALTLEVLPGVGASVLNLRAASGRPVLRPVELEAYRPAASARASR